MRRPIRPSSPQFEHSLTVRHELRTTLGHFDHPMLWRGADREELGQAEAERPLGADCQL
jgi:hypothetical protein